MLSVLLIPFLLAGHASPPAPPATPGPTLQQVNSAIALAEDYLDGLYKQLPDGQAVQSETYGLPLKAYFPGENRWVLLGQGQAGDCLPKCSGATSIIPGASSETTETYTVGFANGSTPDAFRVTVRVDWAAGPDRFGITLLDPQFVDPDTSAQVWLGSELLASYGPGHNGAPVDRSLPTADRTLLSSFRYTVRHATQEAYLYASQRGNASRAGRLAAFLHANGFEPGVDVRAAVFDAGKGLPDGLPFVASGDKDVYADCHRPPAGETNSYPYSSKVCLLGVQTFLLAGRGDAFLQSSQALQTLSKYDDPDHTYPFLVSLGMNGTTPAGTADHLEQLFSTTGYGIPSCTPLGCESHRVSGLRTFLFGTLETMLGYRLGQTDRQRYADAVAAQAIAAQVGASGVIKKEDGQTLLRPVQAGAFPIFWDNDTRFVPTTGITQVVTDMMSMPPEYAGVAVSNSETTLDGYAFLTTYRCARFGYGCSPTAGTTHPKE
ncbi:hypothetical protein [Arthrobacter sp. MAHUQ-56]